MRDRINFVLKYRRWPAQTYTAEMHAIIVNSEVFKNIIAERPRGSTEPIVVEGFSPKIFRAMLKHIFKKPLYLESWEMTLELFRLAMVYDIKSLRLLCKRYFCTKTIFPSQSIGIYKTAKALGITSVVYACLDVFSQNTENVMLSAEFKKANEEQVRAVLEVNKFLSPSSMLALIDWCSQDCLRHGVPRNRENIEFRIARVCGRWVAIEVCEFFARLKNSENLTPQERAQPTEVSSIDIRLRDEDGPDKMQSVFKTDVICEMKITVLEGVFYLTGFRLLLKPKGSPANHPGIAPPKERTLEVFYRLTNQSQGSLHCNEQMSWTGGPHLDVMLSEHLSLKKGDTAILSVCIEDLPPCRCLVSDKEEQFFQREAQLSLNLVSNQRGNCKPGPFFIQKLFFQS